MGSYQRLSGTTPHILKRFRSEISALYIECGDVGVSPQKMPKGDGMGQNIDATYVKLTFLLHFGKVTYSTILPNFELSHPILDLESHPT